MNPARYQEEKSDHLPCTLIIGGAGFIGSHLCGSLLEKNLKVVCLDNLTTGKKQNLEEFLKNPAFSFLENDINSQTLIGKIKPDYIFHLAGVEEYINGVDVSLETLLVNSLGTKNILDLVKITGAKFLLVSSLSIYEGVLSGSSLKDDFGSTPRETQKYTHHEAKRFSEALVSEYFRKFQIDARVARVKDCYGPKMSLEEGSPLSKFFKEWATDDCLNIEGEGLEILHPTYVSDLVSGLEKAMFSPSTSGRIYTIVNPNEISILNFAYSIQRKSSKNLKIAFSKTEPRFRFSRKPDEIKKTQSELNWSPQITPENGIEKTLAFFTKTNPVILSSTNIIKNIKATDKQNIPQNREDVKSDFIKPISEKLVKPSLQEKEPPPNFIKNKSSEDIFMPSKKTSETRKGMKFYQKIFKKKLFIVSFVLILFLVIAPLLNIFLQTALGTFYLKNAYADFKKGDYVGLKSQSASAVAFYEKAEKSLSGVNWIITILKLRKIEFVFFQNLEIGKNLAETLSGFGAVSHFLTSSVRNNGVNAFSEKNLLKIRLELEEIDKNLAFLQVLSDDVKPFCFDKLDYCRTSHEFIKEIPEARKMLSKSYQFLSVFPEIVGLGEKKNYLLLFQNNMELRGGGGFIGSYGLLTVEKGRLTALKIDDIYSIDGQLKGKVTPPDEILHYLKQPNWYLRDSNLEADFPLNAKRAAWFFEKETGLQVDGVIALDLTAVQKLLESTGPVKLNDSKKEITADNLFLIAEEASEVNFFPGSSQKKDFLGELGRVLLNMILNSEGDQILSLLIKINSAINEKHLLFYSVNGDVQTILENISAGGELRHKICSPKESCLVSPLMATDNNFGANKVNYYLDRKISRITTLGKEGEVREKVNINYKNNSPVETWPGGPYKNVLKIYAPLGSKLLSYSMGDYQTASSSSVLTADLLKNLSKDEFLVTESTQSGRTVWTTLVTVPIRQEKTVEVLYELPDKLSYQGNSASIEIFQQKQPGTLKDPLFLNIGYPAFLRVEKTEPSSKENLLVKPQQIGYNTDLLEDRSFIVTFSR